MTYNKSPLSSAFSPLFTASSRGCLAGHSEEDGSRTVEAEVTEVSLRSQHHHKASTLGNAEQRKKLDKDEHLGLMKLMEKKDLNITLQTYWVSSRIQNQNKKSPLAKYQGAFFPPRSSRVASMSLLAFYICDRKWAKRGVCQRAKKAPLASEALSLH